MDIYRTQNYDDFKLQSDKSAKQIEDEVITRKAVKTTKQTF